LSFRVAWCQAAPGGGFVLGGRLLIPLPEAQVRALADSPE
jgi:hypothetical protein